MKTYFYLLSLTIAGIKNIEKKIRLEFYKKTIDKKFDPANYRIKAIYGENGSGKTGIITAVQILREILINNNYLNETANQVFLEEIVNKKTHYLHLECELLLIENNDFHIYQYISDISNINKERFEFVFEKLSYKAIASRNAKYETIFECKEGELVYFKANESIQERLKIQTANLLKKSTFSANTIRYFLTDNKDSNKLDYGIHIVNLFVFGFSLIANLESADQHIAYLIQESLKNDIEEPERLKALLSLIDRANQNSSVESNRISKQNYSDYENKIKQMEQFLRLFKAQIKNIIIARKEDKEFYECHLKLEYEDYIIDTEFESTGIKKLIHMFESLQIAAEGGIVFIDEMDSNINDVYLCKLIEYMLLYGKGQLCFTTHNTSPMSVLKKGKKSIDFLTNDNQIVPWTVNGNYQPESLYRQGLIKYLPFNIEPEDFIGVLGE